MDPYTPRKRPVRKNNLTLSVKEYTKVCHFHDRLVTRQSRLMDVDYGHDRVSQEEQTPEQRY